jgi:hypothetical protein
VSTQATHKRLSRALRVLCCVGLTGGSAFLTLPAAHADDQTENQNRYSLQATGDGMLVELYEPSLPATDKIASSAYSASAQVNSQGNSSSFGSLPYLGAFLETIGGTVNGLSGGATPPIPPAPGYVQSRYPTPQSARQSQGPYLITADSTATSSHSLAGFGLSPQAGNTGQQVYSTAAVTANPDGSTVSTSTAGVRALELGPMQILNVGSSESIRDAGKGGKPTIVSKTDLGTIQVLGFKIGVDQDGFQVLGAPVGTPTKDVLDKVNTVLGSAGMEVTVLPSSVVKDAVSGVVTVTSAALRVTIFQNVPAQGPTKVILTFGRASVGSVDASTGLGLPIDVPIGGQVAPTTPVADVPTGDASMTPLVPGGAAAPPSADLPAPVLDGGQPTAGSDVQAGAAPRTLGFVPQGAPTGSSTSSTYLLLALASAVVVIGQQLFSRFGIRLLLRSSNSHPGRHR